MAYKDILIHIDGTNECQERTRAAIALAKSHEAHLVGLSPAVQFILPAHVEAFMIRGVLQQHEEDAQKMAQSAKDQFERAVSDLDVSSECHVESCMEPELATLISSYARTSDLVVLSQPKDEDMPFGGRRISEEVALASGRPVMLVPYIGFGKSIGKKVLVAWDGSREAARAVSDALPILVSAESVVILSVGQGKEGTSNVETTGGRNRPAPRASWLHRRSRTHQSRSTPAWVTPYCPAAPI